VVSGQALKSGGSGREPKNAGWAGSPAFAYREHQLHDCTDI